MEDNLKMCSSCGVFQPRPNFKRLLTRAQSIARGYVGTHRVEIESKLCKNCQPKPKPLHKLTKKELHNKVESGDVNQFVADSIIKERHATVNQRRAAKTSARWAAVQSKEWRKLVTAASQEARVVQQQLKYAKKVKDKLRQEYATAYLDVLDRLRARLRFAALRPHGAPESVYWVDHLVPQELNQIADAWEKMDVVARARMKQPTAITHRPKPPEETAPVMRLEAIAKADKEVRDRYAPRFPHPSTRLMPHKDTPTTNPTSPEDWDNL